MLPWLLFLQNLLFIFFLDGGQILIVPRVVRVGDTLTVQLHLDLEVLPALLLVELSESLVAQINNLRWRFGLI